MMDVSKQASYKSTVVVEVGYMAIRGCEDHLFTDDLPESLSIEVLCFLFFFLPPNPTICQSA